VERTHLGRSGLTVSRLCLGAMNFGTPGWGCDAETAAETVRVYRDAGGDFFDTANVYGGGASEEILGQILKGSRDQVVIATKVGMTVAPADVHAGVSRKHIRTSIEGSLRRLATDYIDLYQVHHYDRSVPIDETLGALDDLVHAGLVRYIGCSNYFAWQIAEAVGRSDAHGLERFVSAQLMYNLVRRDIEKEHAGCAQQLGVGLIGYGPLHAGLLANGWTEPSQIPSESRLATFPDVYLGDRDRAFSIAGAVTDVANELDSTPGQLALGWVLANPDVSAVLTAAQNPTELVEQLAAVTLDIPTHIMEKLDRASALPIGYPADFYLRQDERDHTLASR
jgi:aryl-alcohol dehydrogenase-like predicted oxidoreductase